MMPSCVSFTKLRLSCNVPGDCLGGQTCSASNLCEPLVSGPTGLTGPTGPTGSTGPSGPTAVVAPTLTNASVASAASANPHVRQGRGTISVTVTGTDLGSASFLFSTTGGSVSSTIETASATSVSLAVTVPHAAVLGAYRITASNSAGAANLDNVFTISALYASKAGDIVSATDPALNAGSDQRPFLTISAARAAIGEGDTLRIGGGTFKDGETWPQVKIVGPPPIRPLTPIPTADWPNGVSIIGTRDADTNDILTVIDGGMPFNVDGVSTQVNSVLKPPDANPRDMTVMAVLGNNSYMRDLNITHFHAGLVVTGADVEFGPMELQTNGYGLRVVGTNASIEAIGEGIGLRFLVDQSSVEGVWVGQSAAGSKLVSAQVSFGSLGFRYESGANELNESQVFGHGYPPFDNAGNPDNIFLSAPATLAMTSTSVSDARSTQIDVFGPLTMRDCSISGLGVGAGLYIGNNGVVDIGDSDDGLLHNRISNLPPDASNPDSWGIADVRTTGTAMRAVGLRFSCTNAANCNQYVMATGLQSTTYDVSMAGAPAPKPLTNMRLFTTTRGIQF